jgi:predicted DNA-binding transcriptional regulator AlpA
MTTKARRAARHRAKNKRHKATQPAGRFVDIKVLANHLGVSTDTVRRLVAAGILPEPVRFGLRTVRWDMSRVQAVLDEHLSGKHPTPRLAEMPKRTTRRGAKRTRTRARPIDQPATA